MKRSAWFLAPLGLAIVLLLNARAIGSLGLRGKMHKTHPTVSSPGSSPSAKDTPPLLIKHLGVELAPFDPRTGRAGDFQFTRERLQFDRIFSDFGFSIPASSAGPMKRNPQPTFVVPLGTKVHALVDGIVTNMPTLWSGDSSIMVSVDGQSKYQYETEHVTHPLVKVGDRVRAGQVIAEVSGYDTRLPAGFGIVEIGILRGGNPPYHLCPFLFLDPSIKTQTLNNIRQLYHEWNTYLEKSVYDEHATTTTPGCLTHEAIEG